MTDFVPNQFSRTQFIYLKQIVAIISVAALCSCGINYHEQDCISDAMGDLAKVWPNYKKLNEDPPAEVLNRDEKVLAALMKNSYNSPLYSDKDIVGNSRSIYLSSLKSGNSFGSSANHCPYGDLYFVVLGGWDGNQVSVIGPLKK